LGTSFGGASAVAQLIAATILVNVRALGAHFRHRQISPRVLDRAVPMQAYDAPLIGDTFESNAHRIGE